MFLLILANLFYPGSRVHSSSPLLRFHKRTKPRSALVGRWSCFVWPEFADVTHGRAPSPQSCSQRPAITQLLHTPAVGQISGTSINNIDSECFKRNTNPAFD